MLSPGARFLSFMLLWGAALLGCSGCNGQPEATHADSKIVVHVDAAIGRRAISPYIYGIAFASAHQLEDLNSPVDRIGGDSASGYNWQLNARSAGQDWFFESLLQDTNKAGDQYGDHAVAIAKSAGSDSMLAAPMLGWVAKLGPNHSKLAAFSIVKYGLQEKTDTVGFPAAGNGFTLEHQPIQGNDPHDAAMLDSLERERQWMKHNVGTWGTAAHGGVGFIMLDNEPAQWHYVHRDVHPVGAHASEIAQKSIAFAQMIHEVDPSAKVVAPEEWVPRGFNDSGFDQQASDRGDHDSPRDRVAETHGMEYFPWLLSQWKQAGHPVDVVSLHIYPMAGEYKTGVNDLSGPMQLLRNRSTRLLWDTTYREEAQAGDIIGLIPRMREWVDRYYVPGTPLALTEYNWGGEDSMNGATAQADILGIFGREGLFLANRWLTPEESSPVYLAFKIFRNPDGHRNGFGETSVSTHSTANPDVVSAFASTRNSDGAVTVVLVNKQLTEAAPVDVSLAHVPAMGSVQAYRLVKGALVAEPPQPYRDGVLHDTLPAQSVTLLVAKGKGADERKHR